MLSAQFLTRTFTDKIAPVRLPPVARLSLNKIDIKKKPTPPAPVVENGEEFVIVLRFFVELNLRKIIFSSQFPQRVTLRCEDLLMLTSLFVSTVAKNLSQVTKADPMRNLSPSQTQPKLRR